MKFSLGESLGEIPFHPSSKYSSKLGIGEEHAVPDLSSSTGASMAGHAAMIQLIAPKSNQSIACCFVPPYYLFQPLR
ncbi:hypothetical protein EON65_37475 [archaeon]|nr:MAG: hypothetical protein EON65_37475 [archaeon]